MESNFITAIFLPLALAVIMLGMGMTLKPEDFRRIVGNPRAAAIGLGNQLVLLPLIGFIIGTAFRLGPEIAVGIMLLAACPGGPTSNMISHLARADVALSISLTAVSSVIAVVTIPLIVNFSLGHFIGTSGPQHLPVFDAIAKILVITLVPTVIGMAINRKFPEFTRKALSAVNIASAALFILVLLGALVSQKDHLAGFFREAGFPALALNVATMAAGFYTAKAMAVAERQRFTISIESGLQNGTLAIAIASSPFLLNNPQLAIAPAIYSIVMFITAGGVIFVGRARLRDTLTQATVAA